MEKSDDRKRSPISLDDLLNIAADPLRRRILTYLATQSENECSVTELAEHLHSQGDGTDRPKRRLLLRLHHVHLPKLMDFELVTYDTGTNDVQYHGDSRLEEILDQIAPMGDSSSGESTE
ncbi:DUF7344 domain-containing protein [Haladaptatus caseinilyticus]|uniref:DUF7344 domain-containing protein n=1 Tax=Haladaptatus caseinilyticus TaxID=2993314 RepID=UPI00224A5574|nr:hypothetical protein [Haladaptatus caseinilyticus]